MFVGKDYPTGLQVFRERVKKEFRKNSHLTEEEEIIKAVARGRWYLNNEIIEAIKLKKYRTMRARYSMPEEPTQPPQPPSSS
jgi:hypothetical protein